MNGSAANPAPSSPGRYPALFDWCRDGFGARFGTGDAPQAMRAIKRAPDAAGILNPGKIFDL